MITTRTLPTGSAAITAFVLNTNVRADDLAAAAAKASALVNRPFIGSPHALEEFPWLLRGYPPPPVVRHPVQDSESYPGDLAAAAAKASALVNRPIVASPHGLEEFPWLLQGYSPQTAAKHPTLVGRPSSTNAPAVPPQTVRN